MPKGIRHALARWRLVASIGAVCAVTAQVIFTGQTGADSGPAAGTAGATAVAAPPTPREAIRAYRSVHEGAIVQELMTLLAIPNLAADSANIRRNANLLIEMLQRRGALARLLESPGASPVVYGSLTVPGATRTVMLYAHYDGQPVMPERWTTAPWQPVIRDGPLPDGRIIPWPSASRLPPEARIYARSASDDKSPIVVVLRAIDALRAARIPLSVNLKVFLEGEEEAGSEHLPTLLRTHRDLLGADVWLFADGPVHPSGHPQIVFGARGVVDGELTVYGPSRELHSGHYGNWAPNPIAVLADLMASIRDPDGHVAVDGFYTSVRALTPTERALATWVSAHDSLLRHEFAVPRSEADNAPLHDRVLLPALNFRGIEAGNVGAKATNAIPTSASLSMDIRLVPDQTPADIREALEAHLRARGFFVTAQDPSIEVRRQHARVAWMRWGDGYAAVRTPMDLPVSRAVLEVVQEASGSAPYAIPTWGGSLPLHWFAEELKVPLISVPVVNYDNNQHSDNENVRLQNLWDGMEIYGLIFARLGALWR